MNPPRMWRIGSRGSVLALTQARMVRQTLRKDFPKLHFCIVVIPTRGDRDQSLSVFDGRDQTGIFTREIERYLLRGDIDIAVHSLKDLPTSLPAGTELGAYCKRENPGDCLISQNGATLRTLRSGARIGTASIRRKLQILSLRPDLRVVPLRGNLTTRIKRVLDKELDAVVVARAGVDRLGGCRWARALKPQEMLPCVGQGILGIEIRKKDAAARRIVASVNHGPSQCEGIAERALLAALHGGCRVPMGALARCDGKRLRLEAAVFSVSAKAPLRACGTGKASDAAAIGRSVAERLVQSGATRYIDEARAS